MPPIVISITGSIYYLFVNMKSLSARRQALAIGWLLLLSGGAAGFAQQGAPPSPDDPNLYFAFLREYNEIRKCDDDAKASELELRQRKQAAATALHVRVEDSNVVCAGYKRLTSALEAIDSEAIAYRDSVFSGKVILDPAKEHSFTERRNKAMLLVKDELQRELPKEAGEDLRQFIEGSFRAGITVWRRQ